MSKVYFQIDSAGVKENILNADFTLEECERVAKQEADKTYEQGYHVVSFKGLQRSHAIAFPNTKENPG